MKPHTAILSFGTSSRLTIGKFGHGRESHAKGGTPNWRPRPAADSDLKAKEYCIYVNRAAVLNVKSDAVLCDCTLDSDMVDAGTRQETINQPPSQQLCIYPLFH